MSNTESIASNCTDLVFGNNGISLTLGNTNYINPTPNLKLVFDPFFNLDRFSKNYLINLVNNFFQDHYLCGMGVEFSNSLDPVRIKSGIDEDTRFHNNTIFLDYYLQNPIELLHEIIHAIVDSVDDNYQAHNMEPNLCFHLDVFSNGSPGFMLDITTRLRMHFTRNQLGSIQRGILFLPEPGTMYPSLAEFCDYLNPFSSGRLKNVDNDDKREIPINEKEFLKLKFNDEYNVLSSIKGFPRDYNKETYIENNLTYYFKNKK